MYVVKIKYFRIEFKIEGYVNLAAKSAPYDFSCYILGIGVKHIEKRDEFPCGYFVQNKCLKFKWDELLCFVYGHVLHCFSVSFVDWTLLGGLGVQITYQRTGKILLKTLLRKAAIDGPQGLI